MNQLDVNDGSHENDIERIMDLTKIDVRIDFRVDTTDVILIVTTGGIGYLAKKLYSHFTTKSERHIALQADNLISILDEARKIKASKVIVSVHPETPIVVPANATINYLAKTKSKHTIEFSFLNL